MIRKCVKCNQEKELEKFRKRSIWFSHTCKECYAKSYRTGKENTGRFKKGHKSWITGKKGVKKRTTPKYIRKEKSKPSEHRLSLKSNQWALAVKTRDNFTCQECKCTERNKLDAHHKIPWNDDESKRFDLGNGITLCKRCHSRTERLLEMAAGKFNLKRMINKCQASTIQ